MEEHTYYLENTLHHKELLHPEFRPPFLAHVFPHRLRIHRGCAKLMKTLSDPILHCILSKSKATPFTLDSSQNYEVYHDKVTCEWHTETLE